MKITVINATAQKGVTYHMKRMFFDHMRAGSETTDYTCGALMMGDIM